MKLSMFGIGQGCGYGNVGRGLADGFMRLGVRVVSYEEPAPASLWVVPTHFLSQKMVGRKEWCLTMYEADNMPEGLFAGFGNWDGMLVPSEMNRRTFSTKHPNVQRIDMGVDWRFWSPQPRRLDGTFRWLYTSHSPKRKGGDVALRAAAILERDFDMEMVPSSGLGLSDEALRDVFWSCHAFVQPSRGEGWGMMPHQALATGMPAVISDCPGHADYGRVIPGAYMTATHPEPSILTFHGDPGMWWEPDLDDLVAGMRWVMENYPQASSEAARAPAVCEERYDWTLIAERVVEAIGADVLDGPDPSGEWRPAEFLKFPVTFSRSLADPWCVAEERITVRAGETMMLTPDQKRVALESGIAA